MTDQSGESAFDHLAVIQRYYDGCNAYDPELMKSTFTDDVVHYFVDHPPVRSARGLAHYWSVVGPRTQAIWTVDHFMASGDEAVIEWSMHWSPPGSHSETHSESSSATLSGTLSSETLRGTEWFVFRGGRIAEIRSYHCNHRLASPENRRLHGFDYSERGYAKDAQSDSDPEPR